ncbi:MAG: hypothetical protein ACK521_10490, partial [bacterium]
KGGILQNFDIHSVQTQLIQDTRIVPQEGFNTFIKEYDTSPKLDAARCFSHQRVRQELLSFTTYLNDGLCNGLFVELSIH